MDLDLEDDEEGAVTPPTGADIAPSLTGPVKAAAAWSSISLARRSAAAICSRESPERSSFFVYRFSSKGWGLGGRDDWCDCGCCLGGGCFGGS